MIQHKNKNEKFERKTSDWSAKCRVKPTNLALTPCCCISVMSHISRPWYNLDTTLIRPWYKCCDTRSGSCHSKAHPIDKIKPTRRATTGCDLLVGQLLTAIRVEIPVYLLSCREHRCFRACDNRDGLRMQWFIYICFCSCLLNISKYRTTHNDWETAQYQHWRYIFGFYRL